MEARELAAGPVGRAGGRSADPAACVPDRSPERRRLSVALSGGLVGRAPSISLRSALEGVAGLFRPTGCRH